MGCMEDGGLIERVGLLLVLCSSPTKAFYCLPCRLLLAKLKPYGLSKDSVLLLESYLSDRFQRVKVADTFSDWLRVVKGALQGSVLGPLFFNSTMNDSMHTSFHSYFSSIC